MTPEKAAAFYRVGYLWSERLPQLACDWLAAGSDSPSLRVLAGETSPIMSEVGPLFELTLKELGVSMPTELGALFVVAKSYCKAILNGNMTPYEGANVVWKDITDRLDNASQLMRHFVDAALEIDAILFDQMPNGVSCEQWLSEIEADIVSSARELMGLENAEQMLSHRGDTGGKAPGK